jgi:hypothetical protein
MKITIHFEKVASYESTEFTSNPTWAYLSRARCSDAGTTLSSNKIIWYLEIWEMWQRTPFLGLVICKALVILIGLAVLPTPPFMCVHNHVAYTQWQTYPRGFYTRRNFLNMISCDKTKQHNNTPLIAGNSDRVCASSTRIKWKRDAQVVSVGPTACLIKGFRRHVIGPQGDTGRNCWTDLISVCTGSVSPLLLHEAEVEINQFKTTWK